MLISCYYSCTSVITSDILVCWAVLACLNPVHYSVFHIDTCVIDFLTYVLESYYYDYILLHIIQTTRVV